MARAIRIRCGGCEGPRRAVEEGNGYSEDRYGYLPVALSVLLRAAEHPPLHEILSG